MGIPTKGIMDREVTPPKETGQEVHKHETPEQEQHALMQAAFALNEGEAKGRMVYKGRMVAGMVAGAPEKQSMRLGGLVINSDRDKITVEELTPAQEAAIDKEAAEAKATAPEPFISPQTRREMEAGRKQLAANQAHLASLPPRPKDPAEGTMTPVYQPGDLVKRFGTRLA